MILNNNLSDDNKLILRGTDLFDNGSWSATYNIEPDLIAVNPQTFDILLGSTRTRNPIRYLFDYNGYKYDNCWCIILKVVDILYFYRVGNIITNSKILNLLDILHGVFNKNFRIIIDENIYKYNEILDVKLTSLKLEDLKDKIIVLETADKLKKWSDSCFKMFTIELSYNLSKLSPTKILKKGYEKRCKTIKSVFPDEYMLEWPTFPVSLKDDEIYPFYKAVSFWKLHSLSGILLDLFSYCNNIFNSIDYNELSQQIYESIYRRLISILLEWTTNKSKNSVITTLNSIETVFNTPVIIAPEIRKNFKNLENWWDLMAEIEFKRLKNI